MASDQKRPAGSSRLVVDDRYRDLSGIGRYAREVVPRLSVPHDILASTSDPMAKRDVLQWARLKLKRSDVLYSPGFAVGPSRAVQVPTLHDLLHITHPRDDAGRMHALYYERLVKPLVRRSGHVITVSPTSKRELQAWLGDEVTVHDCGNGCSPRFTIDGPSRSADRPYAVFVGNLKPHKRPELAISAVAATDLDLVMVVPDPDEARGLAERLGLTDRVTAVSGIDDDELAAIYRGGVATLVTSEWEGFGLPVVESLRCGTPVLYARECESVAELSSNDPASVGLGGEAHPREWASALSDVASSGRRAEATEDWLAAFDWASVADRVSEVLRSVQRDGEQRG
ncbi:glycosyltransferase family 1 protein [Aeromicrobium alkaliterrae]|uniref:Glycosyltransferase family 1 protein n=1 Tax=Aeromicrobium alkaliterrae TaxID=302168 RepID=A0ABN2JZV5_9ACTN